MIHSLSDLSPLRRALLRWYRKNHRQLPWRGTRDPYRILVSEYMLQQTRVQQAAPYYVRFISRFPTLDVLARARPASVLKVWEGLGYYARALNLQRAARRIMREFGGRIPRSSEELRQLPGCGPYTAAAVASIVFGVPEPVLDGNVVRVISRLFGLHDQPFRAAGRKELHQFARRLLFKSSPALFNQAMMELGSTVCTPRRPKCSKCCFANRCVAYRGRQVARIPVRAPRRRLPERGIAVGVIWHRGKVLVAKRRPNALLGGLWEFPGGKRRTRESFSDCCSREIFEEVGLKVEVIRRIAILRYAYTHFKVRLHVFECLAKSDTVRALGCDRVVWERPERLSRLAFPAANRPLILALQDGTFADPAAHSHRLAQ